VAEKGICWTWSDRWRTLKTRGKAEVVRSGTGSARPARPAGTCGSQRDDVDRRCSNGTRRMTTTSMLALAVVGVLVVPAM